MRIRHYFSHLSINSSASYDVRQGFDKQFCVDFIEDCDPNNTRRCQTAPRKPGRPSLGSGGQQQLTHQNSSTQTRSASVPALVTEKAAQVMIFSIKTFCNVGNTDIFQTFSKIVETMPNLPWCFFSFIYAYFLRNFSIFLNAHPGALWQLQHPTYPSFIPLLGELNRCLKFHWPTHTVFDYFELGV